MGIWKYVNTSGSVVDFETHGFYVRSHPGSGMPELTNVVTQYGLNDGGFYQRATAKPRMFELVGTLIGTSQDDLHGKRKALVNAVRRDRTPTTEPLEVRYIGNTGTPLAIDCYYQGGLTIEEFEGYNEQFALRFVAPDPFWREVSTQSVTLSARDSITTPYLARYTAGEGWTAAFTGTGPNGAVRAVLIDPDVPEGFYFAGEFTTVNGNSAGRVARWLGPGFDFMSGGANGTIHAMAIDSKGYVYIGGSFTSVGGVANTARIARWDGANWHALGTGMSSGTVFALAVDAYNNVYAGGSFPSAGGVANTNRVAMWDGSNWQSLGSDQPNDTVRALTVIDGFRETAVYVGGNFTAVGSVDNTRYAARWLSNGVGWQGITSVDISGSFIPASAVHAMAIDPDSLYLYAGNLNGVLRWQGAHNWSLVGSVARDAGAVTDLITSLAFDEDGLLYAAGRFTTVDGSTAFSPLATWNGSRWRPLELDLPGTPTVYDVVARAHDESAAGALRYVGFSTSGTAEIAGTTTETVDGTSRAFPVLTLSVDAADPPVTVYYISNATTGQVLSFDALVIGSNETVTIDLRPGRKTITGSRQGNLIRKLAPGSNLATFALAPGDNALHVWADSADITITMEYDVRYWSVDA